MHTANDKKLFTRRDLKQSCEYLIQFSKNFRALKDLSGTLPSFLAIIMAPLGLLKHYQYQDAIQFKSNLSLPIV